MARIRGPTAQTMQENTGAGKVNVSAGYAGGGSAVALGLVESTGQNDFADSRCGMSATSGFAGAK